MIFAVPVALAKPSASTLAVPINSPGDWLSPNDYPAVALRFDMQGTTAFKLDVDTTGKPIRCEIVASSGFDALDAATCQRPMANAQFIPARDRNGKTITRTYTSRVRWVMPSGERPP